MTPISTDICIVGAGPAGSLLAGLLASAGRDVLLVGPSRTTAVTRLQSLAPAALALLEDEGVDIAGSWGRVPMHVHWPTGSSSPEALAPATSALVNRGEFDAALRAWAVLRGARLLDGRVGRRPVIESGHTHVTVGGDRVCIRAGSVVNAAGSHSVFAQPRHRAGPALFGLSVTATIAVGIEGVWIVAGPDGWVWAASIGDGHLSILTTHHVAPPRRSASEVVGVSVADAELHHRVGDLVIGFDALRPIDLTATVAASGADFAAVGDAAVAIDPLAGQGLAVALRSAAQLGDEIVRGTPLVRSANEVSATHAQLAARYYARGAEHFGTPFWLCQLPDRDRT